MSLSDVKDEGDGEGDDLEILDETQDNGNIMKSNSGE